MTFWPLRQADKSAAACRWDVRAALGKNPGNTSYWLRYFPQAFASKLKRLNISLDKGSESNRRQHWAQDKTCVMCIKIWQGGGLWSCSGSCRVSMLLKLCYDAGGLQCLWSTWSWWFVRAFDLFVRRGQTGLSHCFCHFSGFNPVTTAYSDTSRSSRLLLKNSSQ